MGKLPQYAIPKPDAWFLRLMLLAVVLVTTQIVHQATQNLHVPLELPVDSPISCEAHPLLFRLVTHADQRKESPDKTAWRRVMKRTVIVISLLGVGATLLASGCGDDGPITNTPLTLEQYRDEAAALECEFLFSCCDTDERIKFSTSKGYATPLTQAECKATISTYYDQGFLAEMRKSVDLGRIRFDGQSAATCIAKSTITCPGGKFPAQPDECGAIFVGRVADNGACTNGLECSLDSSSCIHVGGSEMGTCKPRVKEGGPCAPDICEEGLVCLIENMLGTCIKLKSIGEACASRHDCDSYYCDTATNLCAPRRLAGESCLADEDCDSILCDPMTKLCTALKAAGAPCTADIECESYMCDMATQSCAAPPPPWCDGK